MRLARFLSAACTLAVVVSLADGTTAIAADADSPASHQVSTASSGGPQRYIIRRDLAASDARFADAVRGAGFALVRAQPSLKLAVVSAPADALSRLRALPGVTSVARDYTIRPQSLGFDYSTQPGSMTNVTAWTGAQEMWKKGYTGAGIDVALLDTGVAPVPALAASDKVVVGPDLSFESQTANTRFLDSFGHGTVMGGIIAGREVGKASGSAYAADTGNYYGMAPDARLISVKLADRNGSVDVSQVIAAFDWVVTNKTKVGNIRVINLSYGARSPLSPQDDPLSWASEAAWNAGIVVVASAGNDGATTTGLASPAYNPWVIAVGAEDTKNTPTCADDTLASFSNTGNGLTKGPDLLAPGIGIVAPGVPGSYIWTTYPKAHVGNGFIRGSGTSQAAAVVSGTVALLLQQYPSLTPNGVKRTLMRFAATLPGMPKSMQGKGTVRLTRLMTDAPDYDYTFTELKGNGRGSLDAARGGNYVSINGTALRGEQDIMSHSWDSTALAAAAANRTAWTSDGTFNGNKWTGVAMVNDTASWAGRTWQGRTWQSATWQSANWAGRTWQTGTWSASGWSSATWSGPVAKIGFAAAAWSSANWQ